VTRVKICGLTNLDDAASALAAGADALGFILWPKSKRYVEAERVAEIVAALPPFAFTVGVFVDQDPAEMEAIRARAGLSCIQLHGDEAPEILSSLGRPVLKAFRVAPDAAMLKRWNVAGFLADGAPQGAYGGSGETASDALITALKPTGRLVLAGGLTPDNVAARVASVRPYAVDVASGVEAAPGRKDQDAVRRFIAEVRRADRA